MGYCIYNTGGHCYLYNQECPFLSNESECLDFEED